MKIRPPAASGEQDTKVDHTTCFWRPAPRFVIRRERLTFEVEYTRQDAKSPEPAPNERLAVGVPRDANELALAMRLPLPIRP